MNTASLRWCTPARLLVECGIVLPLKASTARLQVGAALPAGHGQLAIGGLRFGLNTPFVSFDCDETPGKRK